MRSIDFFDAHPVFRYDEYVAAHTALGRSAHTSDNLLAKHTESGRLLRVRRGIYAAVSRGADPADAVVDPYLLASLLAEYAAVAYHSALQFRGKAYSVWNRIHYLTATRGRPFSFRGSEFVPVLAPPAVRGLPEWGGGLQTVGHAGGQVRVTSLERAMVDVLDVPTRAGSWEEIWRSLEMVEFFDLDEVTRYTLALGSSLTAARVGFFLERHRESLFVEDAHLEALKARAPRQPRYLDSRRQAGRFVPQWNLVVPEEVLNKTWEDTG